MRGPDEVRPRQPDPHSLPERIIAVVDHRSCSMAAVRHAIPFAAGGTRPLTVLLVKPQHAVLAALGWFAVPASWHSDLQAQFVTETAAVVAPSGVRWDFGVLDAGGGVERWCGDGWEHHSLVVAVRHRERGLRRYLDQCPPCPPRMAAFGSDRQPPPLLAVACDSGGPFRA